MKHLLRILCFIPLFSNAQTNAEHPPLLRVYLDHFNPPQSVNYLKTTVEFINYTDMPTDCDVRVQLTKEDIGNASTRYRLYFYGEKAFYGQNDTTDCVVPPLYSSLLLENQLVKIFKEGLLLYLLQTAWADQIQFSVDSTRVSPLFQDSWNRSTFMIATNGSIRNASQKLSLNQPIFDASSYSANANAHVGWYYVGQRWRMAASSGLTYQEQKDSRTFAPATTPTITQSRSSLIKSNLNIIRSLTSRLSAGSFLGYNRYHTSQIRYSNAFTTALGLEYSLLPYADFFRRRLLLGYYLGLDRYSNTPDLSPTARLPNHQVLIQYAQRRRKGYFSVQANGNMRWSSQYWNTWGLSAHTSMGIEVKRNLFLTFHLEASATNDRGVSAFSPDQQGLFTNQAKEYQYKTSIGITYLLGSGYRNILNPGLMNGE